MGVGLLGGSVGLACRAAGLRAVRVGLGRRRGSLEAALRYDAVDEITLSFEQALRRCPFVVVATPIGRFRAMFEAMAESLEPGAVVTDVGSTKAAVVALAEDVLPKHCQFVGSHPVAGSEKTGVEFARADLFQGASVFVTPGRRAARSAVDRVQRFWTALGGQVRTVTPARHDALLARVSHLPHAAASLLIDTAAASLSAAGPGLMDTTRIASGDPALWRDIFASNRKCVLEALDDFGDRLQTFRDMLSDEDDDGVERLLAKAKRSRDRWIARLVARKELPS